MPAYTKTNWLNDSEPSISAANLNKMEQGIYNAQNDATSALSALGGHSVGKDVPSNAVFTDTVYDDSALTARVSTVENRSATNAGNITAFQNRATQDENRISAAETNVATLQSWQDYFVINDVSNSKKYKCQIQIIDGKPYLDYEEISNS